MTDRALYIRFFLLLALSVILLSSVGCATADNHPYVKAMSSDEAAILCQSADALTTYAAIAKVGGIHEANPLMAGVLKAGGWPLFFIIKAAMAIYMTSDAINPTVAAAVNTATCGIAAQNVGVIVHVLHP